MATIRYYFDTHIAKAAAVQLRQHKIDVLRCEDIDLATASDDEHLAYAAADQRTLVTHDADFRALHWEYLAMGRFHAGIFLFAPRFQGDVGKLVRELIMYDQIIRTGAGALDKDIFGALVEIDR